MLKFLRRKPDPERERHERLERQRREVGSNGWTCHVCGDYRPDAAISVYSSTIMLGAGIPMQQNVRYCNDRPECVAGAPNVSFYKGGE